MRKKFQPDHSDEKIVRDASIVETRTTERPNTKPVASSSQRGTPLPMVDGAETAPTVCQTAPVIDKTIADLVKVYRPTIEKALKDTPSDSFKLPENLVDFEVREARENDVAGIVHLYQKHHFPRAWFEVLADRKPVEELEAIKNNLSGGGELLPIPPEEWLRRIREERVLLFYASPDGNGGKKELAAVHSYIVPDNETNREKIEKRVKKIDEIDEAAEPWIEDAEADHFRHILMTEDIFISPGIRNKGIHIAIFGNTIKYETELTGEKKVVKEEEIDLWDIYYWVNKFVDAWKQSKGPWMKEKNGAMARDIPKDSPYNGAMVQATVKAGGHPIGYTKRPEGKNYIELPSLEDLNIPHVTAEGDKVCLVRWYLDVWIPAKTLMRKFTQSTKKQ